MVNDDSQLYTLKIRWNFTNAALTFHQFLRAQYWRKMFLAPFNMAAKTKFASLWQTELDI